ncbi:MAG: glycosyltransferase family 4 protein [Culturomica sp.]|jgi:glycosyltransferase involved in cell wall biosynthesis|nr:glycosyltransferase family 4 protein [Culturomica sp.]
MKIGFDAKRLYNNFTGLGNYSRVLVGDLKKFYPDDSYYLYTPKIIHNSLTEPFLDDSLYTTVQASGSFKSLWRTFGIKKELSRNGINIYHGLSHELPVGLRRRSLKTVVTMHDVIFLTFPEMYKPIDRKIYDIKYRYSCHAADKIIAISESTKSDLIKYYGINEEKISVIYQSMQPAFYDYSTIADRIVLQNYNLPAEYMLYVGSVNERKNLLSVVKAMKCVKQDLQLPLVIIGNGGDYKKQVMRYAETNGMADKLLWISNVHETETLRAFYKYASLFIYPSFYEGFGLPVTEALMCKTPVITSNVTSLPEAGGTSSVYVSPSNIEEIAAAIEKVLTDQSLRDFMRENGLQFALEQFNPQKLTAQVHKLYEELV